MRGRVDANQSEVVKALRKAGATVRITSNIGQGFPDIVVGFRGNNYLLEIKDGTKCASAVKLTEDELKFFAEWRGQKDVVYSIDDALNAIGAMK